ncbi:uncharacterized protein K02A2.6-like [Lineus longissimus]|uniref:uncharacterized protein K02A2.6-like n=1 Tax=Lineus longissimus TaxID=88925 RepID=UPI00315CD21B
MGVIQRVTEPTEWCAPMVPVVKKGNRGIRICVDLKRLNRSVVREKSFLPSIEDVISKLSGAKHFSKLDCSSGFWAIPLDPDSAKLTTFITPFGRFCFRRLCFVISSAPEIFQTKMANLLKDHDGVIIWMDDILIYAATQEEHDKRLQRVLDTIEKSGLKLNRPKCQFDMDKLDFIGHCFSAEGVCPSKEKVKAIQELAAPQSVTELKRVLGMITYLGRSVNNLSTVAKPMTDLLKKDTHWSWGHRQQTAFEKIKEMISSAPVLSYYDPSLPTTVSADAISYGLGGVLLQEKNNRLSPVAFASRTLTDAEKKYAQIEKEAVASVWACEKFSQYLYGLDTFKILTDHKPLVPLMIDRDLDKVLIRCQRLLMRLMRFNAKVEHVPGKTLVIADALSRSPLSVDPVDKTVCEIQAAIDAYVESVENSWNVSLNKLEEIRSVSARDQTFADAMKFTLSGWPDRASDVPMHLKNFYGVRNHLSVANNLLLYDNRIAIPAELQQEILARIHDGHMGVTKSRERAKSCVWWPGLINDIQNVVEKCSFCQEHRPKQNREPLITTPMPSQPWDRIGADLFTMVLFNHDSYLVMMDYFSRYIEIAHLGKTTTSKVVIGKIKAIFARRGIPRTVVTDNGPQFSSVDFAAFANDYGFEHITSSPTYAQSNGEAEAAVKIAKRILKQPDPYKALLAYRATPIAATGFSPAEMLMGRQLKTTLPVLPRNTDPEFSFYGQARENDESAKTHQEMYYNRKHGVRPLPNIAPGNVVRVKTDQEKSWKTSATVIDKHPSTPRSFIVQTDSGSTLRRNRRHLQSVSVPNPGVPSSPCRNWSEVPPSSPCRNSLTMTPVAENNPSAPVPPAGRVISTRAGRVVKPVQKLNL